MATGALTDSLRETLALFEELGVPQTTPEVADRLDLGRRSTYNRLDRLVEHGQLETKKVGASARVWWRPPTSANTTAPGGSTAVESLVDDALADVDVGIFVLDENFDIAWLNAATERYFGLARERVVGKDKRTLVEEHITPLVDDADAFAETVLATYDDNTYTEQFECHVTPGDGHEGRWLEHRSQPIESGAYAGGRVELYYDITGQKRSEYAHQEARAQFEPLVEAVKEYAIFMLDSDGYVRTWNAGAEQIKGYAADEILGEHLSTFYTEDDTAASTPEANLEAATQQGTIEDAGWRVQADGSRFWANITITAIRDDDGDLEGYVKITRDMTERREHEQQLRHERELVQQIFETAPVGIGVLSTSGDIVRANKRAEDLLGITDDDPDEYVAEERQIYDVDGNSVPPDERPYRQVLDTGTLVLDWQCQIEQPNGVRRWLSVNAAPLEGAEGDSDRIVVTGEDITQLKEQAHRLERQRDDLESELDEVFNRVSDGFYALDSDRRFRYINDHAVELLDLSQPDVIGSYVGDELALTDSFEQSLVEAVEDGKSVVHEEYYEPLDAWFETAIYPSESGVSVYFRDTTERKESERELKQYETIVETVNDGVYVLDSEARFVLVNDAYCELTGYDREELLGSSAALVVDEETRATAGQLEAELMAGKRERAALESELQTADGETVLAEATFAMLPGEGRRRVGVVRDITERKEREQELERYVGILDAVGEPVYELDREGRITFVNDAVVERWGYEESELLGEHVSIVLDEETVEQAESKILDLLGNDPRETATLEFEMVTKGGRRISAENRISLLTDEDGQIRGTAGVLRDVTERKEREQELERQREQLAALNNLNDVVRNITDVVIDQSTREEIEAVVCDRLASADSYTFAWIAEVDPQTQSITPRVEAGADGYLEEIALSTDPDDPAGRGPGGRAIRTQDIQVVQDALVDSDFEPWRKYAKTYGYRSSAAIPIVYDDTLYGLLGVYADRPKAFSGEERDVIAQLGEIVGHAIAAVERKQALMSDRVTELEFTALDILDTIGLDSNVDGTITFDRAVPTGDGTFLEYGTVDEDAIDALESLVDQLSHFEEMTIVDRGADTAQFELRLSEPPVVSAVAAHGGYLQQAKIEDGDFHLTIHLPATVAARRVIDEVMDAYPTANLLRRRQITRSDDTLTRVQRAVTEDLTDRQRASLKVAVYSGFFEWPRRATGEELAESLGIAAPTFSQHLRKAQKKVFESLFSTSALA